MPKRGKDHIRLLNSEMRMVGVCVCGGDTYFWRQSLLEFCGYHSLHDCTVYLVHCACVLLSSSHTKMRFNIIRRIDD